MQSRVLWAVLSAVALAQQASAIDFDAADAASEASHPQLTVTNLQGAFVLSWPIWATNWVLEQTAGPRVLPWTRISPGSYENNGVSWRHTISPAPASRSGFYRLRHARPPSPGATGHWSMDEGTGPTANDGAGFNATMFLDDATWGIGRIGPGAVNFNGRPKNEGGSFAWVNNVNYGVLPSTGRPFSVSFWFNPDVLMTGWQGLAGNDPNGTNGWTLALHTPGPGTNYLVFAGIGSSSSLSVTGRTLLLPGQWHELTITHDGAEGRVYLDASLLGRAPGLVTTHDGPVYFGGTVGDHDSFWGRMDEIRVYTNALTHEEISLTGHWGFDESPGAFVGDSSINVNHAGLTSQTGRLSGRQGSAIRLSDTRIIIPNDDYNVLPGSGGPFSVSFWVRPDALPTGRTAIMSCGSDTDNGWQLGLTVAAGAGETRLWMEATNNGGTLALATPIAVTNGLWTKVDITYNGGIATAYANGRKLGSSSGAIRGTRAPLIVGAAPGAANFNGIVDELKIYRRERGETEIGPVARTMWETVFINSATNLALQGFGPPGKPLTYTLVPIVAQTNGRISLIGSTASYQAWDRKGPDAFAYTVSDGEFTSLPAIVTVSIVQPHWLSPLGGTGSSLDGSTPERAWSAGSAEALDAVLKTNSYYDCFFYAPGEYETTGWKYLERSTANPGCKHVGSGSMGAARTVVRLVNVWEPTAEGWMLASPFSCNGFEVHHMVLDCNAANNPKYALGKPVWIRIPLTTTSWVHSVELRWRERSIPGASMPFRLGRGIQFDLCNGVHSGQSYITNCASIIGTSSVDVVTVATNTAELLLRLNRRDESVDFYSLAEIEVTGAQVSLPSAMTQERQESRLNGFYPILSAVDENSGTFWVSGPEQEVEIVLPLEPNTPVSQLKFEWKCKTVDGIGRLGAASAYIVRARDQNTGEYFDVPIVRHGLTTDGFETATFGTTLSTNTVITDRLAIFLTARDPHADYYGLSEVGVQNSSTSVKMRLPDASSTLPWGLTYGILRAFDRNEGTEWVSDTQGMIGALAVHGSNLKFTNLKVIGFGSKARTECFPMFISPGYDPLRPQTAFGNILIEDCLLTEPATNNTEVVTVVAMAAFLPDTLTNAVIRRCTVANLRPYFPGQGAFSALHVENSLVVDCKGGVYFEPMTSTIDDFTSVLIRSNVFVNVDQALSVQMHPGGQLDSITFSDNEVILSGQGGWGFASCDVCAPGPSGSITNVTALNNVIRYADWMPRPGNQDGGLYYSDIHHAVFGNNVIALGTSNSLRVRHYPAGIILPPPPTEDCEGNIFAPPEGVTYPPPVDPLRPGYRRAWFNNRNVSGALLDVRTSRWGFEGPAAQQQWPE